MEAEKESQQPQGTQGQTLGLDQEFTGRAIPQKMKGQEACGGTKGGGGYLSLTLELNPPLSNWAEDKVIKVLVQSKGSHLQDSLLWESTELRPPRIAVLAGQFTFCLSLETSITGGSTVH